MKKLISLFSFFLLPFQATLPQAYKDAITPYNPVSKPIENIHYVDSIKNSFHFTDDLIELKIKHLEQDSNKTIPPKTN